MLESKDKFGSSGPITPQDNDIILKRMYDTLLRCQKYACFYYLQQTSQNNNSWTHLLKHDVGVGIKFQTVVKSNPDKFELCTRSHQYLTNHGVSHNRNRMSNSHSLNYQRWFRIVSLVFD